MPDPCDELVDTESEGRDLLTAPRGFCTVVSGTGRSNLVEPGLEVSERIEPARETPNLCLGGLRLPGRCVEPLAQLTQVGEIVQPARKRTELGGEPVDLIGAFGSPFETFNCRAQVGQRVDRGRLIPELPELHAKRRQISRYRRGLERPEPRRQLFERAGQSIDCRALGDSLETLLDGGDCGPQIELGAVEIRLGKR